MPDPIIVFDERTGQRILKVVRFVELWIRGGGPGRARWPVGAGGGSVRTVLTPSGGIPASGSATCTFYDTNGGTQTLGTETALVYNDFATAFNGNRKVKVHTEGGAWRALVQSCS